jgi:hypothetical protein
MGMRLVIATSNQYFGADRGIRCNRIVVALLDAVFVMSTTWKGVINEQCANRTEEL